MNLSLDMSLKLQQKLSFQLIQSLKLLQVNTLQLEQLLRTELELNPVLEMVEEAVEETQESVEDTDDRQESDEAGEDSELETGEEEIDWEQYIEEGFDLNGNDSQLPQDKNEEHYERTPVYRVTLFEHLTQQLAEKTVPESLNLLAQFIIGNLETDGYLRIPLKSLAEAGTTSVVELEEALQVIWTLEPSGVGARTLQECLLLQLRARGDHASLAARMVADEWDLLERLKIPDLARRLGVDVREVQEAINILRTLNPKPGYAVASDDSSVITPDLIVQKVDDEWVAMLNDGSLPMLRINKSYARMLKRGNTTPQDVKQYIREKLNSANWLVRSIEQRKSTMLKVMYAILDKQRTFFDKGPPNLDPLKLQDIADIIGMHISTVSRVTSGKYVQTPHGIYELKYFFTESLGQNQDGVDISAEKIRNTLRGLVENEDAHNPLSDQRLADMLTRQDMKVARRTVAKYREQLKILPARLRQRYD